MRSLRDREVAWSASDRQGLIFEPCGWKAVSSHSSHNPQEVLLAQFSLYVHSAQKWLKTRFIALFSSSSLVLPRSAHYWQQYYMKTKSILNVSYYSCQTKFTPHIWVGYSWGGGGKGMFLPLVSRSWYVDPVCFTISPLSIRSSIHINFTSLAIIPPISNENYVSITYVTMKAPGTEKSISWAPHQANWLATSHATNYRYFTIRKYRKKIYYVFYFFLIL